MRTMPIRARLGVLSAPWLALLLLFSGAIGAAILPHAFELPALTAEFNQPSAVATDGQGHFYVLDGTSNRVVML